MALPAGARGSSDDGREKWHPARLLPTIGIRGQEEQEKRATSSLLAVMAAVPEFGQALVSKLGGPKGRISTFAEVQLKMPDGKLSIPDGAIVVERGKTLWRVLVEVKTGSAQLQTEQVGRYLDIAREHGMDGVLTISNQIVSSPEQSPVSVDRRKLGKLALRHMSWWRIITEAVVQHRHRGVTDPDQAWILGELIAYLDHEASGASGFQDMGDKWVAVRDGARHETLRASDPEVQEVANRWEQFVQYLALGLSQDLGADVQPVRGRRQTPQEQRDARVKELASDGKLTATIRVPDAIAPIELEADLRTRRVSTAVSVDAPNDGRAKTRISWMLRQLRTAPDDLRVDVAFANTRETTAALLREAHENPDRLLSPTDPKRLPRGFRLAYSRPMGTQRGKGERSFVAETRQHAIDFYRDLVQNLRPWRPTAPKLPEEPRDVPMTPQPDPPPFSAGDEREPGEALDPTRGLAEPTGS
ncbi:MAG: stress response protein [Actinomycetota bacterium]|nr:stress response protein [Actinomycetota bacterium]